MMLKIKNSYKTKLKIFGAGVGALAISLPIAGFYNLPNSASAAENEEWRTLSDISTMQEMTTEICGKTPEGMGKSLQDVRDGSEYYVQKLTDGNCWMLQNLKLTQEGIIAWKNAHPDGDNNYRLSSKYSDVAEGSTFAMPATITDFSNYKTYQYSAAQIYNGPNNAGATNGADWQVGYGAYYNWYAATAGKGNTSQNTAGQDIVGSICPRGWRLPTGNKTASSDAGYEYSFNKLINGADKNDFLNKSYTDKNLSLVTASGRILQGGFFTLPGFIAENGGGLKYVGSTGSYWSSTVAESVTQDSAATRYRAFALSLSSSNPAEIMGNRGREASIRCLANPDIHSDLTENPNPATTKQGTANIALRVGDTLTIDAIGNLSGEVDYTRVLRDSISATVFSNKPYDVMLSAKETSLKDPNQSSNAGIPTVLSGDTLLQAGVSGWGIYTGTGEGENMTYEPMTTTPKVYHNTTSMAEDGQGTVHSFGVGVAVSPSVVNGTYSTSVTITAANS